MYSSNPEQVAQKFGELVSNLHLDLEQTGVMMARYLPNLTYNRIKMIMEMAEHEREILQDEHDSWGQLGLF